MAYNPYKGDRQDKEVTSKGLWNQYFDDYCVMRKMKFLLAFKSEKKGC